MYTIEDQAIKLLPLAEEYQLNEEQLLEEQDPEWENDQPPPPEELETRVAELKSKLDVPDGPVITISDDGSASAAAGGARADLRAALEGLGYGADEIHGVLSELPSEGDTSDLLKEALRRLATGV